MNKYLALSGLVSRRRADELIAEGKIMVNGNYSLTPGTIIDTEKDMIVYQGKIIKMEDQKKYLMLNKPIGYVSSLADKHNPKLITDLIGYQKVRLYPIGRLDKDSCGLLLMTNDGDLTYRLTHPKHELTKTYIVIVDRPLSQQEMAHFQNGVNLDGYTTAKARIKALHYPDKNAYQVKIHEGKYRQIRRMFQFFGIQVLFLKRIAIGKLQLGSLPVGKYRYLTTKEIEQLKETK